MKDFMKRIKADFLLSSLMCIGLGIVFVVWKDGVLDLLGSIFAVILVVIGAVNLLCFFLQFGSKFSAVSGIVILAVGIWFLIDPAFIAKLIPIVIGVVLLFHGVRGIQEAFACKRYQYDSWYIGLILAVISIIGGILCIVFSLQIMRKATMLVGSILIYNGISNIWIASRSTKAEKNYKETIDVEFVEK